MVKITQNSIFPLTLVSKLQKPPSRNLTHQRLSHNSCAIKSSPQFLLNIKYWILLNFFDI